MVETARVQCVFLDIVGFTKDRSVEAQSDLVATLNAIVSKAMESLSIAAESAVLLPTGDGMALALVDVAGVDVHLRLALEILRLISEHNAAETDVMRQFEVRIGINENIDNLVMDINGRRNIAGAGISMAQRIMDKADGGQVLVGQTVYEVLRQRESYLSSFRKFRAKGKHGIQFDFYQFVSKDAQGLNVAVPSAFAAKGIERAKLSEFAAHYICHAIANRDFLAAQKGDPMRNYVGVVLLALLATDSIEAANTPPHEMATTRTWRAGSASFEEQYRHYREIEFWLMAEFADLLASQRLSDYSECFVCDIVPNYVFVSSVGIDRLCAEWPQLPAAMGIPMLAKE